LDFICAPKAYDESSFCGRDDIYKLDSCDSFASQINLCFTVDGFDGENVTIKRRENDIVWKNHDFSECEKEVCLNETGFVTQGKCKGDMSLCVDGECLNKSNTVNDINWIVVLEIEGVNCTELAVNSTLTTISDLSGVIPEEIIVGVEIDDDGQIVRVYVFIDDEEAAYNIANFTEECVNITSEDDSSE